MLDSLALGPVESDTLIWESIAHRQFQRDSVKAKKLCDQYFSPVSTLDLFPNTPQKKIAPPQQVSSFLTAHEMQVKEFGKLKPAQTSESWLSGILLLILLLVSILNWRYFNRVKTLVDAFLLNRFVGQIVREENVFLNRVNLLLTFMYLLIVGAFFYISIGVLGIKLNLDLSPGLLFLALCGGLVVVFAMKMFVILMSGFIFDQPRAAVEYTFSIFLYNQMAALILLPILAALLYVNAIDPYFLVLTGVGLLIFFYLFRLFRIITGSLAAPSVSTYYLFLYLCTLEFLPAAVAVKFIIG